MTTEYKRLPRCGIDNCKSTLFHLEAGQWFCKNGHLKSPGHLEATADDEDNFGTQGQRKARAVVEEQKPISKVLRGRKGFELYMQCYQIVLQKQVWWLVHERGFPEELELVVRDLWVLRCQVVASTIPGYPAGTGTAGGGEAEARGKRGKGRGGSQTRTPNLSQEEDDEASQSGYSSQSSYLYTSGSESASTNRSRKRRRQRHVPKASDRPHLLVSVAMCYLGLVLLRQAVPLGDFHRWIEMQQLPYLRAIKDVPAVLKAKLSAEYHRALDPSAAVKRGALYRMVQDLIQMLQRKFGMTFPPLDLTLMLKGYIEDLGLPLELYTASKRLAEYLTLHFSWPLVLGSRKRAFEWPEARIMALLVISCKLCYGLDGIARHPKTSTEPAGIRSNWDAWESFLRATNKSRAGLLSGSGTAGKLEVDMEEADVFSMKDEDMDRYMDWYEKTWCGEGEAENLHVPDGILKLFPTSRPSKDLPEHDTEPEDPTTPTQRLTDLHSRTERCPARPDDEDGVVRPGQQYLYYSLENEIPHQLQTLLQAGADLLGIERRDLANVVSELETKIRSQVRAKRAMERREQNEREKMERRKGPERGREKEGRKRKRGKRKDDGRVDDVRYDAGRSEEEDDAM